MGTKKQAAKVLFPLMVGWNWMSKEERKEEWKEFRLCDIAIVQTGPFGSQLHNKDYVMVGTPIVTVEHLGSRQFSMQNLPRVSEKDTIRLKK